MHNLSVGREYAIVSLLRHILSDLDRADVRYCVLRDGDRLDQMTDNAEVDFLVDASHLDKFAQIVTSRGFVRLRSIGHAPHHFFVGHDHNTHERLKLDAVTELRFGRRIPTVVTDLGDACLEHRQRLNGISVPSPEDELLALLLHCVLDKGKFTPPRRTRIQGLRHELTAVDYLANQITKYWLPGMTWEQLVDLIDQDEWETLLATRSSLEHHLRQHNAFATMVLHNRGRVLQKVNRVLNTLFPLDAGTTASVIHSSGTDSQRINDDHRAMQRGPSPE